MFCIYDEVWILVFTTYKCCKSFLSIVSGTANTNLLLIIKDNFQNKFCLVIVMKCRSAELSHYCVKNCSVEKEKWSISRMIDFCWGNGYDLRTLLMLFCYMGLILSIFYCLFCLYVYYKL